MRPLLEITAEIVTGEVKTRAMTTEDLVAMIVKVYAKVRDREKAAASPPKNSPVKRERKTSRAQKSWLWDNEPPVLAMGPPMKD